MGEPLYGINLNTLISVDEVYRMISSISTEIWNTSSKKNIVQRDFHENFQLKKKCGTWPPPPLVHPPLSWRTFGGQARIGAENSGSGFL